MGLVRGLVLALDRRAVLAVLAIGVSVGYALFAGATVTGLEEAQDAIGTDPDEIRWIAHHPDGQTTPLNQAPGSPAHGIALVTLEDHTNRFYTAHTPSGAYPMPVSPDHVLAGPATGYEQGDTLRVHGQNLTVETGDPVPGAPNTALGLNPNTFADIATHDPNQAHTLIYDQLTQDQRRELQQDGYETHQAPASLGFYEEGAEQLVAAIAATVGASTIVVGLLASGFVTMELRAKRESFATLKTYGGTSLVRKLVAARGTFLIATGHLIGLGLTLTLVLLVTRAGALDLSLDPTFTAGALAATLAGGLLGLAPPLATANKRLEAQDLTQRSPPRWLPKPLRLTLTSWRITIPLTAAAIVLAASLGIIYGMADMPGQLFGHEGDQVIADTGNPLRGEVDPFPGYHLANTDGYTGSSPEIFAPTLYQGSPTIVRGVHGEQLTTMEPDFSLTQGTLFTQPQEATAGHRLASTHQLEPGDQITLPSPYTASTSTFTLTGIHQAGTLLDDEILTSLPTARDFSGQRADTVSLIRYNRAPETPPGLPTGIEVTDIHVDPPNPLPHEQATVTLDLANFAPHNQTRQLTLTLNDDPADDAWPTLQGRTTDTTQMTFRTPPARTLDIAVNPERTLPSGQPAYTLDAPDVVLTEQSLPVTVQDTDGDPAQGVTVHLGEDQATTDQDGTARLPATTPGNRTLLATGPDGRGATWVLIVERGDLHTSRPTILSLDGPSTAPANGTWTGTLTVENLGGNHHDGPVQVPVNDSFEETNSVEIPSGQRARATLTLELPSGEHTIGPSAHQLTVTARDPGNADQVDPPPDQRTVSELLEARRNEGRSTAQTGQTATQAFLGDTFGNLNAALTIFTLATVAHAGLVVAVAVFRDVEERASIVGTLASVGAGRGDVRLMALREFAVVGFVASLVGVGVGLALAWLGAQLGFLVGFGHALVPRMGLVFGSQVGVTAVGVVISVGVFAVDRVRGREVSSLLRSGPERAARPPLERLVGGGDA